MEIYVEEALTEEECIKKIHKKYGDGVSIIRRHIKTVPYFFGLFEKELCEVSFSLVNSTSLHNINLQNKDYAKNVAFIDAHAKRVKAQEENKANEKPITSLDPVVSKSNDSINFDDASYEKLKGLVEELASKIENNSTKKMEHANLEQIREVLRSNDFSENYISSLIEAIKKTTTVKELEDYSFVSKKVLDYIASSIEEKPFTPIPQKKIVAFVGPTGVGKTTSLIKLAALHFVHIQDMKKAKPMVHVITTDGYKIGAVNHIEKYCNCMDLSLSVVDTVSALRATIDINKEKMDMILIDTSGRNPNDKTQLAEVEKFLSSINKDLMEVHLIINASTKMKDIALIMEKYQGCRYDYVIISKLDETSDIGNVVSVLSENKIPISFIATGQTVPTAITFQGKKTILNKLKGFELEASYIEENYSNQDSVFGDNIWLTKQKIYEN